MRDRFSDRVGVAEVKRFFDLIVTVLALPVVMPVIVICVIIVKISSSGPAIFRQTRVGRNEKHFTCYKLRSMYVETRDAPSHQTAASAITPAGRWLRRFKLDELPQLWNILKGDMSYVGPRPCLPVQVELIEARRRLGLYVLRPGITGIAQVARIDMSDPKRLAKVDATYLGRMSFWTDLRLILVTVLGEGRGDGVPN